MTAKFLILLFFFCVALTACTDRSGSQAPLPVRLATLAFISHTPQTPYAINDNPLEPVSGKTAFNYFIDEQILVGWNLGNSLDSYRDGIGHETAWSNPRIEQEIMDGVKAAGFDIIRIPVTWMGHIGEAPDHRIAPHRLARVAEVVEMAHSAGLKVIINLHHDGSTPSESREDGWLSVGRSFRNINEYNRITHKFARVWEQIALYFRNYGDWLMFESMNEIHDGGWGWSEDFRTFPIWQLEIVNNWNQVFTDVVRSTGGNNLLRYLVIPAYCTIPEQTLSDFFILPLDIVPNRQVVTFHYYDPHEFGVQGSRPNWGTPADRQRTDDDFAPFKPRFVDNNIPVIIGECGAVLQLHLEDEARHEQARQSRFQYTQHVFATAGKYGLIPLYWDNGATRGDGEKFGLFDRRTGLPNSPDSDILIKMMINSVK